MNSIVTPSQRFRVIDSHTAGEPTRVLIEGAPELPRAPAATLRKILAERHDDLRRALVLEPRGNENAVGAILLPPETDLARATIVFFNNVGYLDMCVHGLMGVVQSMAYAGMLAWGGPPVRFETPAGWVEAEIAADGSVLVNNVRSFRWRAGVEIRGRSGWLRGDVAYGGNWFFIVHHEDHRQLLERARAAELVEYCRDLADALATAGITGPAGEAIDHIQLTAPAQSSGANARNFVLCPGRAYDRSPCGTGSCARLACLAADGRVAPGELWIQESIIGSRFELRYQPTDGGILPSVRGRAHIVADGHCIVDPNDPYRNGIES